MLTPNNNTDLLTNSNGVNFCKGSIVSLRGPYCSLQRRFTVDAITGGEWRVFAIDGDDIGIGRPGHDEVEWWTSEDRVVWSSSQDED